MDNKNLNTSYVPLQPPYQIIKYGEQIGMQIGTLITTLQLKGDEQHPFKIETHSFPVVSYRNKDAASKDKHLVEKYFMEGTVWDRVELHRVITICMSDSHLPWQEFVDMLWSDIWRTAYYSAPQISLFYRLSEFGVKIDPIPPGIHEVHLQTYCGDERPIMVRTDREDIVCLNVDLNEYDTKAMASAIYNQISNYIFSFAMNPDIKTSGGWSLKFTTDEEMLRPLVELLNKPKKKRPINHLGTLFDPFEEET